ncbi:Histone H1 [Desulfarculales bacterium]
MFKRSNKPKRLCDLNELAAKLVGIATGAKLEPADDTPAKEDTRNPHAAALGYLGGLKGGKARASKLTPEERKAIAQKAAKARWSK